MVTQELIDFIKKEHQEGKKKEEVKDILLKTGWQETDVESAINQAFTPQQPPLPSASVPAPVAAKFLGPIELLKNSLEIFKRRYKTLIAISVIPIMIYVILGILAAIGVIALVKSDTGSIFTVFFLPVFIIIIVSAAISSWSQIALLFSIKDNLGLKESYKKGWHKILSTWWIGILMMFIIFGGFMLLVIPGIIFSIWFIFALFILVSKDTKGFSALLKSKELVRGRWFGVFLRSLFIVVIYFAVIIVISIPINLFGSYNFSAVSNLFLLINLVIGPIFTIYFFLMYKNLNDLKGEFSKQ